MVATLINRPSAERHMRSLKSAAPFGGEAIAKVRQLLASCPAHKTTPLVDLDRLANSVGLGAILVKDERDRMGQASFKSLGGVFAVLALAAERSGRSDCTQRVETVIHGRSGGPGIVFTTATAGNHGRSVAAGAHLVGCRCVVFIYDGVCEEQVAAIAGLGAEIVPVAGGYDDAVAACRATAERDGWQVVSDVSWTGYEEIPRRIMQGYAVIAAEVLEQASTRLPTHVFVQAGVGGLAGALAAHLSVACGGDAPRIIVVEPAAAACLFESARLGGPRRVAGGGRTNMARLECLEPSPIAWDILTGIASGFVTVSDQEALAAAVVLSDLGLATSPSGAVGLAGAAGVLRDPTAAAALGLGPTSRVMVIATEQPTAADRAAIERAASF